MVSNGQITRKRYTCRLLNAQHHATKLPKQIKLYKTISLSKGFQRFKLFKYNNYIKLFMSKICIQIMYILCTNYLRVRKMQGVHKCCQHELNRLGHIRTFTPTLNLDDYAHAHSLNLKEYQCP